MKTPLTAAAIAAVFRPNLGDGRAGAPSILETIVIAATIDMVEGDCAMTIADRRDATAIRRLPLFSDCAKSSDPVPISTKD